jgi:pimeloyl-ACP methyl ester carboxylesterase
MQKRTTALVSVTPDVVLWTETTGDGDRLPIVLLMGANASGLTWPDAFVDALAVDRKVVRYDHRDTGRSTRCFPDNPYPLTVLADDVVKIMDALEIERAHVVGMSLGGTLTQVLLLDNPERLASATLFGVAPLEGVALPDGIDDLPGPAPHLLELWSKFADERSAEEDLAFAIEHWRALNGGSVPFDEAEFARLETRLREHAGDVGPNFAHAMASQDGLDRGSELASVNTPTLVIDATNDPTVPAPTTAVLAASIPLARVVAVTGMGHALPSAVIPDLAAAIISFANSVEA